MSLGVATAKAILLGAVLAFGAAGTPSGASSQLGVPGRSNAHASIAAKERFVAVAWGAAASGRDTGVYVATSRDAGVAFGRPTRVNDDSSQASHHAGHTEHQSDGVARAQLSKLFFGRNSELFVVWDEQGSGRCRIALGRRAPDNAGAMRFRRQVLSEGLPASYPVVAATADGVVAAWTSGNAEETTLRVQPLTN